MKSFNGLYDNMINITEIKNSIIEAADNKRNRSYVRKALYNLDQKAETIQHKIENGSWHPPQHKKSVLREGAHKKEREIEKPTWDDEQIVHHMLMRQFWKITYPRTYKYACGAVPGRGPLYAVNALKRAKESYHRKKFYVAELDIKKFYDSIDTEILKSKLRKTIRDKRYLNVLFKVIDAGAPGLPKGFYTSPCLSNYYLIAFDNYILQSLKPDFYLRYMDNLFLFHSNKRELHRMVDKIEQYLWDELHLQLNDSKQVFRMEYYDPKTDKVKGRAINVLGYVIHYNRTTLRKSILERARAKANRMYKYNRCTIKDARAMISYWGWFKHTDTKRYYKRWIAPKVDINYCKERVGNFTRMEAKRRNERLEARTRQPRGEATDTGHNVQSNDGL